MSKGLYFYKLVSPYEEDVTKDCKLTINEIDSNFINLKDADVKNVTFDKATKKIQIIKNNDDVLETDLSSLDKKLEVSYDSDNGIMTIFYGEEEFVVDGLVTDNTLRTKTLTHVNSDGSLYGLGTNKKPLGLKEVEKTGQVKPCKRFVDLTQHETLPKMEHLKKGDRFLVKEKISDYGYLYDFKSAKLINSDLKCGWRIPSKADWDNMLNAIEECTTHRTHDLTIANKELGKVAGKLLKSTYDWVFEKACNDFKDECTCKHNVEFDVDEEEYWHHHFHESQHDHNVSDYDFEHHPHKKPVFPNGVDAYKMTILPSGYGDGCKLLDYFGKRTAFWTSTMIDNTDVYVKRFDYNKSGVVQTAESPSSLFSLRLVKDYDGSNFNDIEYINGQPYPCILMPSLGSKTGYAIWTARNVAFTDAHYAHKHIPSDGKGHGFYIGYFTSEWNGHAWDKKLFKEGDSVVLINGLHYDSYDEYRLINGELINVAKKIYNEVRQDVDKEIKEINARIDDEIENRIEADNALSGAIDTEIERAISAETELREDLNAEIERAIEAETELRKDLENEIERAISAETELREDLNAEIERAISAETELREDLNAEIERAISMDEALSGAIETEIAERIKEDEILHEALSAETAARIEYDEYLKGRLVNSNSTYDSVNGELILTTDNPDNNITIQFNGNYGTF